MSNRVTEIQGEGDPILFVHGLGGTSNVFTPQVAVLQRFFKCVRPDLPGSGRSATPGAIDLVTLADDMAALIEENGGGRWHVVGHSLGTIVCQHLAVRRPDLVRSLVLVGPLLAPPEGARTALRDRAGTARQSGMAGIADAIVQGGTSANTKAHQPAVAALVREMLMRQEPEGYALTCEALAAVQGADVAKIAVPTLLLTGDEDGTAPPRAVKALAAAIGGAEYRVLDRCGHWATFEAPSAITNAALNFLLDAA